MNRQQFLYDYLVMYNELENNMKMETHIDKAALGWEKYDENNETSGQIFCALRNKLVHDTQHTLIEIEKSNINYDEIIQNIQDIKLDKSQQIRYVELLITTSNLEKELKNKGYELFVCDAENNPYRCFSKMAETRLRINIFFHHRAKFIVCDVSTYNHNIPRGRNEYYNNEALYIECEYYNDVIGSRIFIDKHKPLPTRLDITYDFKKNKNEKYLIESNWIAISTMEEGIYKTYTNKPYKKENQLDFDSLLDIIQTYFDITDIENICTEVKQLYNEAKGIIRKVGVYL